MFKFVYNIVANSIYPEKIDKIDNNFEVLITKWNYMEINDYLLRNGELDLMIFVINNEIIYSTSKIYRKTIIHDERYYKETERVFEWVIENKFKFNDYRIIVPGLIINFDHICYSNSNKGGCYIEKLLFRG